MDRTQHHNPRSIGGAALRSGILLAILAFCLLAPDLTIASTTEVRLLSAASVPMPLLPAVRFTLLCKAPLDSLYVLEHGSPARMGLPSLTRVDQLSLMPVLSLGLLSGRVSIFATASLSLGADPGRGTEQGRQNIGAVVGGLKVSHAMGPVQATGGMNVIVLNMTTDSFTSADALLLQPFAAAQLGLGPCSLSVKLSLNHLRGTDDDTLRDTRISYTGALSFIPTARLQIRTGFSGSTRMGDALAGSAASGQGGSPPHTRISIFGGVQMVMGRARLGLQVSTPVKNGDLDNSGTELSAQLKVRF